MSEKDITNKGNILIVDDLPDNLNLLYTILSSQGYEVWPAPSGKMALETMRRRQPDLILLDIRMPEMGGFEVCKRMKADDLLCDIPIIFISALSETEDKVKAFQTGGVDYITKPFQEEEVVVRVKTHLTLRKMKQHIENDLYQTEKKYQKIFNAANDAIVIFDIASGRVADLNRSTIDITGYSHEEITNFTIDDLSQITTLYSQKKLIEMLNKTSQLTPHFFEWQLFRKSGEIVWLDIALNRTMINEKDVIILVARDISKRKTAEKILFKSEARLKEAQSIAQIGHWEIDMTNNRLFCSDEAYNIIEMPPVKNGISFMEFLDIVHPEDKAFVEQLYSEAKENREIPFYEYRIITRNGKLKYLYDRSRIEYDDEGTPVRLIGTAQDITKLKEAELEKEKLENQLLQGQKIEAVGTLAGGIAHDFNNILSPIFGYAEFALDHIEESLNNPEKLKEFLGEIMKAAERARNLVRQILTFSRKTNTEKEPLNLATIIKEAVKLLKATIPTTIEIHEEINSDKKIVANPTQIHQVVMNLCTNAYHAMRLTGGYLTVKLSETEFSEPGLKLSQGEYLHLQIKDTGHGIDKKNIDNIFEPYFTTKEVGEGTGLGLSVVHGIIEGHNGYVDVESEVGKGTVFNIYFPVVDETEVVHTEKLMKETLPTGKEKILVVEDEEKILRMIKEIATDYGYKISGFECAKEALIYFEKQPENFDLVITDMTMPQMTGLEFAQEILKIRHDIPVILTTGYSELVNRELALSMGIRAYVEKPLKMSQLIKTVQGVINNEKNCTA